MACVIPAAPRGPDDKLTVAVFGVGKRSLSAIEVRVPRARPAVPGVDGARTGNRQPGGFPQAGLRIVPRGTAGGLFHATSVEQAIRVLSVVGAAFHGVDGTRSGSHQLVRRDRPVCDGARRCSHGPRCAPRAGCRVRHGRPRRRTALVLACVTLAASSESGAERAAAVPGEGRRAALLASPDSWVSSAPRPLSGRNCV